MTSALFSASWYRVSALKPRLRGQARIARHHYRGERWYVLQDLATGKFMRLNRDAYRIVALMDGERSLDEIWQNCCLTLGDQGPTQDEILQLLGQLHQSNVLLTGQPPDLDEIDKRRRRIRWSKIKHYFANPLTFRIPLIDPDRFLGWLAGAMPARHLGLLLMAWAALVASGVAGAAMHWGELTNDMVARVFTTENMLLLALTFPFLKALHEIGHGLAIKMLGGSCHEMGLMFLVAIPVPYVDASQSTAFTSKRDRMLVGLAGMMAELAVAAIAFWLWTAATPGVGKALLHQVVILAGFTTLVFNGNPLLRFDGYYVLSDWLEIPNLGQKSNRYLGYVINRLLFGVRDGLATPPMTAGEAPWLLGYAVLSFAYRMMVALAIVLLVAQHFYIVGVLLAIWYAWSTVGTPLARQVRYLANSAVLRGRRVRAWTVSAALVTACAAAILFVPVGSWTSTEGIIWMPEQSRVRAAQACFGVELMAQPGMQVKAGQPLLSCADAELDTQASAMQAKQGELLARLTHAQATDRVQAQIVEAELGHVRQQLADLRGRQRQLVIESPHDGRLAIVAPTDFPGKFFNRGDVMALVLDPSHFTLLAVVGQGEVDQVRAGTRTVELRMADALTELLPARIEREVPAATNQLPSLALALQGGGKIGLNPESNAQDPLAVSSLFQFELSLQEGTAPQLAGQRVHVHFVHDPQPLADQWYRSVRQLFLKSFST